MGKPIERHLTVRLTPADKAVIDRAVRQSETTVQAWAKSILMSAAEDHLVDPAARSRLQRLTFAHAHVARTLMTEFFQDQGRPDLIDAAWADARAAVAELAPRQVRLRSGREARS